MHEELWLVLLRLQTMISNQCSSFDTADPDDLRKSLSRIGLTRLYEVGSFADLTQYACAELQPVLTMMLQQTARQQRLNSTSLRVHQPGISADAIANMLSLRMLGRSSTQEYDIACQACINE